MHSLIEPIAYTLLHSLWQGAVITAIVILIDRTLPSSKASLHYLFNVGALALFFVVNIVTFIIIYHQINPGITGFNVNLNGDAIWMNALALPSRENVFSFLGWAYTDYIIVAWLAGMLVMLLRVAFGLAYLKYLLMRATDIDIPGWHNLLTIQKSRFNIDRSIVLKFSHHIDVPCVIGFIKPVILFPIAHINSLSIQQVEDILSHELAHIKRYDFVVNLIQHLLEVIYFFNPFVWIISSMVRTTREQATDDLALAYGAQPLSYIETLAAVASMKKAPLMANKFATNNNIITRIKRLTGMKTQNVKDVKSMLLIFIAATVMGFGLDDVQSPVPSQKVKIITSVKNDDQPMKKTKVAQEPQQPTMLKASLQGDDAKAVKVKQPQKVEASIANMKFKTKVVADSVENDNENNNQNDNDNWRTEGEDYKWEFFDAKFMAEWSEKFQKEFAEKFNSESFLESESYKKLIERVNSEEFQANIERLKAEAMRQGKMNEEMEALHEEEIARIAEEAAKMSEELARMEFDFSDMEKEMTKLELKMKEFEKELNEQLAADGYIKKGEKAHNIEIGKNRLLKVDGKEIKKEDQPKYDAIHKKYFNGK